MMAHMSLRQSRGSPTLAADTGVSDGDTIFSLLLYKSNLFNKEGHLVEVVCPSLLTPLTFT